MMNRRGFLAALAGAMMLDPERLLWVPGRKMISIPRSHLTNLFGLKYYSISDSNSNFMGIPRGPYLPSGQYIGSIKDRLIPGVYIA